MPVYLKAEPVESEPTKTTCTTGTCASPKDACVDRASTSLAIGLINNMADGALLATERQFITLLDAASPETAIYLSFYAMPDIPHSEAGARHIANSGYQSTESLPEAQLDGMIVTGREPLTPNLSDEPYWRHFVDVLDWARQNTLSTVWSCLAAHAAVLSMDGIRRVRNENKQSGVFECEHVARHPLTAGAPAHFSLPHSRWNGLPEDALKANGYRVLTRTSAGDVDTFVKPANSLFVFFQGHPEYEPETLLLEYRRDVGRFLRDETRAYPGMPQGYFDAETTRALTAFQKEAEAHPSEDLMVGLNALIGGVALQPSWRPTAACIYRNWLRYMSARKKVRIQAKRDIEAMRSVESLLAPAGQAPSTTLTASTSTPTIL